MMYLLYKIFIMPYIEQILSNNGFKYKPLLDRDYGMILVENLEIVHVEQMVEKITVSRYNFYIHINFKCDIFNTPVCQNLIKNFDVNGYHKIYSNYNYIRKEFDNENDFINELQRLNPIGLNIKG